MPNILVDPNSRDTSSSWRSERFGYKYPPGLDLRPGSLLHNRLVSEVLQRARESRSVIQKKEDAWNKLEQSLTAYVPLSEAEQRVKDNDSRKPVSIVVPVTYAALETLLTYWVTRFLQPPYFKFKGTGPEDAVGAALLEAVIWNQCVQSKVGLSLYTMWRDAFVYGFGVTAPRWEAVWAKRSLWRAAGPLGLGSLLGLKSKKETIRQLVYEGNVLENIDPYRYLPDPNVPIQDVQRSEHVGWIHRTHYPALLALEQASEGDMFNVQYLRDRKSGVGRSQFISASSSARDRLSTGLGSSETSMLDVIYMYVNLIPKEWSLGSSVYPEKWLFGLACDDVIIQAQPLGLDSDMYPIAVCAPTTDGYSVLQVSKLEVTYGLQETIDWLVSAHIANVRKAVNDMFIYDPLRVNSQDLRNPEPGKLIRLRQGSWGTGVEGAIKQFPVSDVTQGNIQNIPFLMDVVQRVLGTVDILQGVMRTGGERRSAQEARDTKVSAVSRLDASAMIGDMQAHWDIAKHFASNTQQFASQDTYIKATGRLEEILMAEYGYGPGDIGTLYTRPQDLSCNWDLEPADLSAQANEDPGAIAQLLAQGTANPEIAQRVDMTRMFLHAARLAGFGSVQDFLKRPNPVTTQVMQPDELERQQDAGQIVPLEEAANAAAGA